MSLFNYLVFHNMNSKAYLESFTAYNQRITNLAFQNIDKQIVEAAMEIPKFYFSETNQNQDLLIPQEEDIIGSPARVRGLVKQMETVRKAYPYVSSVDVYYEATKTVVTGFTAVHDIRDDQEINNYIPWYEDFSEARMDTLFLENAQGIYPTNEPVITYVSRISRSRWKDRGIIVAVHISLNSFREYIDESEGCLILTTPGGEILYRSQLDEWNGGSRWETEEMEDMTMFSFPSFRTGLKYVYYIQNSTFYADYNVRNRIFLMNFLISIVFNLLILVVLSWINHYTFKKQVLKASREAGIQLDQGKTSIDQSLNVLTKEILTLNETVKSSQPLLRQNAVRALILNRDSEMVKEQLHQYLCYDSVCTVLNNHVETIQAADVVDQIQEMFLNRNGMYHALFTTMERGEVVSVLIFDREHEKTVLEDFRQEMDVIFQSRKMVVGEVLPLEKDNIKNSYRSAVETAQYCFIFPERSVLRNEDVGAAARKGSGSHLKLFDFIERDINSGNYLDFKYHVEALLVSFKEGSYTIDYCHSTLRDLVGLLYQIMSQKQLDMWIVFGYDIRQYYKQIENIDEFGTWVLGLCEVLLQNLQQKKRSVDTDMQTRLIQLIDDNLEHDISLDFLSDQFSLRPDVLSRTFKQMMGKSYSEYIKEKKLGRALELLKEDYSIKEIAMKLGYNSPQYFIKIFKEVYGVTPYQYKKEILVGKENKNG